MKNILTNEFDNIKTYNDGMMIKILQDTPFEDVVTYASINSFNYKNHKELCMLFNTKGNVEEQLGVFAAVIDYFTLRHEMMYAGGHTQSLGEILPNSSITAFFLRPAYIFDDTDEEVMKHYFWVVPITHKEFLYLEKYGPMLLDDHLNDNNIDILNLYRADSL